MNILIVDDEYIMADGLYEVCEDYYGDKAKIYKAYSAKEAIQILEEVEMQIVLTDVQMPGLNGLELQEIIDDQWKNTKVLFLSAYNEFEYVREAMRHNSVDYILKLEGDEAVLKAIDLCIKNIEEEERNRTIPFLKQEDELNILNRRSYEEFIQQLKNIPLMIEALDLRRVEQFQEFCKIIISKIERINSDSESMGIQGYFSMGIAFYSYINKLGLYSKMQDEISLQELLVFNRELNWREIEDYFLKVGKLVIHCLESDSMQKQNPIILKIENYIFENICDDISLNTLADYVNVNASYLSRLYKQERGKNLLEYINVMRLNKCYELLNNPQIKVSEIAVCLGFSSHSYFTQFFKRMSGITPIRYREIQGV